MCYYCGCFIPTDKCNRCDTKERIRNIDTVNKWANNMVGARPESSPEMSRENIQLFALLLWSRNQYGLYGDDSRLYNKLSVMFHRR